MEYCFCFGSIPSFFLELFLQWSPVAYWAPTDLGSSSFGILSFCLDSWTWHSRFLCNIALYSIRPCFYQSHPHWVLFLLWLHPFILSGVISPMISTSTLSTYWPGKFIFQCPIFLPFPYYSWVPEELWTEVHKIVQEAGIKIIPKKNKCKKAKWLSEEALQIAVKRREMKSKGEKERYTHLNAEFQRIAKRDKTAFLRDQCKEIEEN